MIIGRAVELKYLNTHYSHEGSQIMVVYGEKNAGKTELLKQFTKDKPFSYYKARSASEREQCYQWGRELPGREGLAKYPVFSDILNILIQEQQEQDGKKVIIIDEFQYIVKASDVFMEELVNFVRSSFTGSGVMVILCSSSIGWVENSMITRIGKAAYELSGFLKVKELEFEHMMEYFPGFSMKQGIETYAVLGGLPGLWKHFDDTVSIEENICKHILDPSEFLYGEGQRIVEEEFRETGVYNTILAAIAAGNHKLNNLYLHTGFSRAKISVYLKNLMEFELVEKVFSYDTEGKANVQKGIYRIKNHFVNFYFTFLYPNLSSLDSMRPAEFYNCYIAPYLKSYVSDHYRMICMQYMKKWSEEGRLPIAAEESGEWVGKLGNIDVIMKGANEETIIGLCNFERPMMGYDDYEWLLFCAEKAMLKADYIYLFSINRFDERLKLEARIKQNLKLITVEEM